MADGCAEHSIGTWLTTQYFLSLYHTKTLTTETVTLEATLKEAEEISERILLAHSSGFSNTSA